MRYAYSAEVRRGYLVPAGGALLLAGVFLTFVAIASLSPASYAARGLQGRNLWFVAIWGSLVAWALAACVPSAIRHCQTFLVDESLRVSSPFGVRQFPWQSIREIQIARVPSSRNMKSVEQWIVRLFSGNHPILIYDELCEFEQLVKYLDRIAEQFEIPLYATPGLRRWEKTVVHSLSGQLHL